MYISYKQEHPPTGSQDTITIRRFTLTLQFNPQAPIVQLSSIDPVHNPKLQSLVLSPAAFSLEQFFSLPLTFMALTCLKITGQWFYRMSLYVELLSVFSWLSSSAASSAEMLQKQCRGLSALCRGLRDFALFTENVGLHHSIKVVSARPHWKLALPLVTSKHLA